MPRFLKQTTSGAIFIWQPQLAERADMVPYEPEITSENPSKVEPQPEQDTALAKAIHSFRKEVTRKRKPKAETSDESQ